MGSASPAPVAGASTGARGLRALAPAPQRVRWPDKFKTTTLPRYGGATDPLAFLLAYEEAILEAGGDNRVMANWLPMALTGAPRTWLLHLPAASVASWEELHSLFLAHHATPTPPVVAALLGGSQAPPTSHHIKPFIRRVSAAPTRQGALPDRAAPKVGLAFNSEDHPSNSACSGALPMLCTPTLCQVAVTRTLIDGSAGLNVLSV